MKENMDKFLDQPLQHQLKKIFTELMHPVKVVFFSTNKNCAYCEQIEGLLSEVAELSDKLTFVSKDIAEDEELARLYGVNEAPVFVLLGDDNGKELDYQIRFYGMPGGHEFTSLINDLMLVSRRDSGLQPETRKFLKGLTSPVHLQVFVTPTCPYCPQAVVLAHQMAIESDKITADMVEALEFPEWANEFNVSGVPQTTINMGAGTVIGGVPEDSLVEQIKEALAV